VSSPAMSDDGVLEDDLPDIMDDDDEDEPRSSVRTEMFDNLDDPVQDILSLESTAKNFSTLSLSLTNNIHSANKHHQYFNCAIQHHLYIGKRNEDKKERENSYMGAAICAIGSTAIQIMQQGALSMINLILETPIGALRFTGTLSESGERDGYEVHLFGAQALSSYYFRWVGAGAILSVAQRLSRTITYGTELLYFLVPHPTAGLMEVSGLKHLFRVQTDDHNAAFVGFEHGGQKNDTFSLSTVNRLTPNLDLLTAFEMQFAKKEKQWVPELKAGFAVEHEQGYTVKSLLTSRNKLYTSLETNLTSNVSGTLFSKMDMGSHDLDFGISLNCAL